MRQSDRLRTADFSRPDFLPTQVGGQNIRTATHVGDYRLQLCFDDDTVQTVDFRPFLARSRHPDIRAWLDPARFAAFRLVHGELVWGDYDLCFPIMDLYHNRIEHGGAHEAAA